MLGRILPNFEAIRDIMVVLVTCKNKEERIKNEGARVITKFSPIITLWELSVAIETRALIRCGPKLMQPIPHPNDAPDKFDYHPPAGLKDIYV